MHQPRPAKHHPFKAATWKIRVTTVSVSSTPRKYTWWFAKAHTQANTTARRMFAWVCNMPALSWLSTITQRTIWAMSIDWTMTRKAVVITGKCVNTKQRELLFVWCWVFRLKLTDFVATSNQWKLWCTTRILCCNKSFQRNCTTSTGIPNLGAWCKKWFN